MRVLVTGAAGFIGFHTARALALRGDDVIGVDSVNDYYDVSLKEARIGQLAPLAQFNLRRLDISDRDAMARLFAETRPQRVIHLAAQAGVRYAAHNPHAYADSNLVGFLNILEGCRHNEAEHLVFASSSSVYGANTKLPFSERDSVDHPVSLYAATKKANELMAHSYAHLYRLPTTGLRFFTVYGPWGRPDMALFKFASRIVKGEAIDVFNNGHHSRDFTYIDDIVEGVVRVLDRVPPSDPTWDSARPNPATSSAPYRIYNIGNNQPVQLMDLIGCLEASLGRTTSKRFLPMQPGDVCDTYADIDALASDVGFRPATPIEVGIERFVAWFKTYYGHN